MLPHLGDISVPGLIACNRFYRKGKELSGRPSYLLTNMLILERFIKYVTTSKISGYPVEVII